MVIFSGKGFHDRKVWEFSAGKAFMTRRDREREQRLGWEGMGTFIGFDGKGGGEGGSFGPEGTGKMLLTTVKRRDRPQAAVPER